MNLNNKTILSLANCIRSLSLDAITNSKSGHIGMVLGMADIITVLYAEFLKFNPNDAKWQHRDRFVMSNGHGSMLLYSLLYLTGYSDIKIDDLKQFRKFGSKTAGHPEYGFLEGIEVTTGPLGQGIANSVGMAIASKKSGHNNKIYCSVGDGCLMEGISYESMSLAGHLKLNNLVVIFDDNSITIDGKTNLSFSENHEQRFLSQGWNVIKIGGHNIDEIRAAFKDVQLAEKPTVIMAKTIIGYGSLKYNNTNAAHSIIFNKEDLIDIRKYLNIENEEFFVPNELLETWRNVWQRNKIHYNSDNKSDLENNINLKDFFYNIRSDKLNETSEISTRKALNKILNECYKNIPNLIGGSADLSESTCVKTEHSKDIVYNDFSGNFINYGVREHAMGGIMNGISLYGSFVPLGSTFFAFSDYMKPSIRMAAQMNIPVIFAFTHDSIGVGEDGATHQPVEQLISLNAMPNLLVIRPASETEMIDAMEIGLTYKKPTALICSRQNVKQEFVKNIKENKNYTEFGAYFIVQKNNAKCVIVASGSEVGLAFSVAKELEKHNIFANVVSMPCCKLFDLQSQEYQNKILGRDLNLLKIGIEAFSEHNMAKYLDYKDLFFGVNKFGHSGSANSIFEHFGLTEKNIVNAIIQKYK